MNPLRSFINFIIRSGTGILCRVEKTELQQLPHEGPLIAYVNHIGSIEVPLLYSHLYPRKLSGLAKMEAWDNPLFSWLFDQWGFIPVWRGEADLKALKRSIESVKAGHVFGIAPEGTRSQNGKLLRAHPGTVVLALKSNAPLIPVAHWGIEKYPENIRKLKRTEVHIRVGKPFLLDPDGVRVNGDVRQEMADEIMIELAKLMPEKYHGYYAGQLDKTCRFIRYLE